MLTYLHVKNIALIDEMEIDFNDGFNIMTGETGAGKSIIIGSINAVLGNKLPKDFIRKNEDYALIELIFQLSSKEAIERLKELDIDNDEELLISRRINQNGRSVFKMNNQVVNASDVKEITSLLIDLHSQHEHQSLLNKKNHIKLVDRYLGDNVEKILYELKNKYKIYMELKNKVNEFSIDIKDRKQEIDFLSYEINEIESAKLTVGEDDRLEELYKKQANMQVIHNNLSNTYELMSDSNHQGSMSLQISRAIELLNSIKNYDNKLVEFYGQLEEIDVLITEFGRDIYHYIEDLDIDEESLAYTGNRIHLINGLKMKHGNKIEDILEALSVKKEKLDQLINYEENINKLNKEIDIIEKELIKLCSKLTRLREDGANKLAKQIVENLKDLNLKDSQFKINISKKESYTSEGWDDVEFMITTNIGEELKPLIQIASGGELSRVMLAIKSVFANCDEIATLIFDEIDSGISGRTAQMVAEKMVSLSKSRQLICITHLPQIAAMADSHYLISKNNNIDKTITSMIKLKEDDIPHELSRLIGGAKITDSIFKSAVEMKKLANEVKKNWK